MKATPSSADALSVDPDLIAYADPLFELYGVTTRDLDSYADEDSQRAARSALQMAELFASFFYLDPDQREDHLGALEQLLAPDASADERQQLASLFSLMQRQFESMRAEGRLDRDRLPSFPDALRTVRNQTASADDRYGEQQLTENEAMAVFARPLIEREEVLTQPHLIEEMSARAEAHWHLAQLSGEAYELELRRLVDRFASSADDADALKDEARQMTERFAALFPSRAPSR